MMARPIDADELVRMVELIDERYDLSGLRGVYPRRVLTRDSLIFLINRLPTIDPVKHGYVSKEVLDQIRWERDIAMSYLEEAGVGFGEKAELQRVKHGKWIWDNDAIDWGLGAWVCSECHGRNENIPAQKDTNPSIWAGSKFCPNCGARMDGE